MTIHLQTTVPAAPANVYELLTNGAKLGDVTGMPGKGGGAEGAYFSLVRLTLTADGTGTTLTVDQDNVPDAVHEHVRTNWAGFYFEPLATYRA